MNTAAFPSHLTGTVGHCDSHHFHRSHLVFHSIFMLLFFFELGSWLVLNSWITGTCHHIQLLLCFLKTFRIRLYIIVLTQSMHICAYVIPFLNFIFYLPSDSVFFLLKKTPQYFSQDYIIHFQKMKEDVIAPLSNLSMTSAISFKAHQSNKIVMQNINPQLSLS